MNLFVKLFAMGIERAHICMYISSSRVRIKLDANEIYLNIYLFLRVFFFFLLLRRRLSTTHWIASTLLYYLNIHLHGWLPGFNQISRVNYSSPRSESPGVYIYFFLSIQGAKSTCSGSLNHFFHIYTWINIEFYDHFYFQRENKKEKKIMYVIF